jgi:cytochrome c biogenesis protein CcdA
MAGTYHRARYPARLSCSWLSAFPAPVPSTNVDPASGIGIPVAFGAGLISFLSPCVLPLVPGYISAVAGVKDTAEIKARRVIGPSLAFVGTFSAIFIALGLLGQRAIRGALTGSTAVHVCGILIAVMGLLFVASPFIPRLAKTWHVESLMARAGKSGPVLTGAAFAIAWTPCTGPTLGAIVSAAGTSNNSDLHGPVHGAEHPRLRRSAQPRSAELQLRHLDPAPRGGRAALREWAPRGARGENPPAPA